VAFLLQPNHASAFWHTTASIIFLESVLQSQKERLEKQVDKWGKTSQIPCIWDGIIIRKPSKVYI